MLAVLVVLVELVGQLLSWYCGVSSFCDLSAGQRLEDHERGLQCGVVPGHIETVRAAGRTRLGVFIKSLNINDNDRNYHVRLTFTIERWPE